MKKLNIKELDSYKISKEKLKYIFGGVSSDQCSNNDDCWQTAPPNTMNVTCTMYGYCCYESW